MLGCYDFCGHYEWTFAWLERAGGRELLEEYWREAIARDSQRHADDLIREGGIEGMKEYWGHTLDEESPDHGYSIAASSSVFRVDIHDCPSKGFLIRNKLEQHSDYCDHCIGWIRPVLNNAGFDVDHEHNHRGQCWWEIRKTEDQSAPSAAGEFEKERDVRLTSEWTGPETCLDAFAKDRSPASVPKSSKA